MQRTLTFTEDEQLRAESQSLKTLRLLQRGPKTRAELIDLVSHRFSASIKQLRLQGYDIQMSEDYEVYTLHGASLNVKVSDVLQASYYLTEHWQGTRQRRMEFDGYRCSHCRSTVDLHVHHWQYDLFAEAIEDLTTLCDGCHKRIHQYENVRVHFPRYVSKETHARLVQAQEATTP